MTAVTVVGTGAIGGAVASTLRGGGIPGCTLLAAVNSRSRPDQITAAVEDADVVVEATRTTAAAALIRLAVPAGTDIVLCSAGVLADPSAADLATGPGRILLPAGAIGGLDILSAAARAGGADVAASHTTVKRPGALGLPGLTGAPVEVFRGSARGRAALPTHLQLVGDPGAGDSRPGPPRSGGGRRPRRHRHRAPRHLHLADR